MTSWQATSEDRPTGPDGAIRAVGLAAVSIGIAALAAATFVLSYQGIRAVALQADIEPRYARGYPLLIDAMLVIVLAAVLALRGAGLPSRILAWLTLLVVLSAAAGADTLHATGRTLPHNAAVVTAAVLPWALVLVAFVLLLAMLRHARLRRHVSATLAQASWVPPASDGQADSRPGETTLPPPLPVRSPQAWNSVSIVPGFTSQLVSSAAAGAAAGAAVADVEHGTEGAVADDTPVQLAATDQEEPEVEATEPVTQAAAADPGDEIGVPDHDMSAAEAATELPALAAEPYPHSDEAELLTDAPNPQTDEAELLTDAPNPQTDEAELLTDGTGSQTDDNDMPVFHRIRSSPTPPEE